MERGEAERRLAIFGIPGGATAEAAAVRGLLAHLLASGAVALGELQTARDIMRRKERVPPAAALFLAAMFVSLRDGNTVFNLRNETNTDGRVLADACRRTAPPEAASEMTALEEAVGALWPRAVEAALRLKGDIIDGTGDGRPTLWFFDRQKDAVAKVSRGIATRLRSAGGTLSADELASVVGYSGRDGKPFALGGEQQRAVQAAVAHTLTVITGGPGTGKTTIVCSLLRALLKKTDLKPADVALAAPTGRAAQRMGEALRSQCGMAVCGSAADAALCEAIGKLEGTTVHSLLGGYGPRWTYNASNPLPHRLVVVDECSMVDLLMMRSLLEALRTDCRLVLLGDRNQLPSVEAGAVLGDLLEIGKKDGNLSAFVELRESRRFTGQLKTCAEQFNAGVLTAVDTCRLPRTAEEPWTAALTAAETENRCFWYELSGDRLPAAVDRLTAEWAGAHGLLASGALVAAARAVRNDATAFAGGRSDAAAALFAVLAASRIVAVVKNGPFGVRHINERLLQARLGRHSADPLAEEGIPVIITENTPSLNLFNGDVGVTVRGPEGMAVLFPRGEKVVCCPVPRLPGHDLAYAMTVHKSQGSEFENVMVVLPDDDRHPLLNRQIVYTGVTRAKKRAVILGTGAALKGAVERELKRDTGLALCSEPATNGEIYDIMDKQFQKWAKQ